jgi:hypothetical protein
MHRYGSVTRLRPDHRDTYLRLHAAADPRTQQWWMREVRQLGEAQAGETA